MTEKQRDILIVENQDCPVCFQPKAVFSEYESEDPYVGPIVIFAIKCNACGFKNSDIELVNPGTPAEYKIDIEGKDDLDIRIIKNGSCQIKIPNFRIDVDSSMNSEGFISNVEGLLLRFKRQIYLLKDGEDDKAKRKKIKTILSGIDEVLAGEKKITIKLIDDTGNSAIVSDKVEIKKIKPKKSLD